MLSIVGTRLYVHEGDNVSFRVVYKDSEDNIKDFKSTDDILLTIYNRDSRKVLLSKKAENINFKDSTTKILTFNNGDYSILKYGDYKYNIILKSIEGGNYSLITEANLTVVDNIIEEEDSTVDLTSNIRLCSTPLICKFDHIELHSVDGSLIIF